MAEFGVDPFERRYQLIMAMPEGREKTEAMQQLFQDYPGKMADATDQIDKGFEMATMQPAGMTQAGPANNPFTIDVGAGALLLIGNAGRAYMGGKQMREGRDTSKELSAGQDAAMMGMANAALQQGQAGALRGEVGPDGLTDEERRQRKMMLARSGQNALA
jgi:hypothetical protein